MRHLAPSAAGLALLLTSTLLPARVAAATYEVGPDKPYADLEALPTLVAGDLVLVDGDQTYPAAALWDSGEPDSPITIQGVVIGGNRPVLDGGVNTLAINGDHWVIEGVELTGGSSRCFYHHGDDVTLRDAVVHDCDSHGILGADQDSGSLTLEYVEVYACGGGTQHHQIYVATDEVNHPG